VGRLTGTGPTDAGCRSADHRSFSQQRSPAATGKAAFVENDAPIARCHRAENRKILAASFDTPDGGSRGAGAVGGAFPDKLGNTALLQVRPDGKVKFTESRDWGAGRGALLGGVIGIIGGPIGILAGGGIGALAAKVRDSGFKNDQLEQLGRSLAPGNSAVVFEIAADTVPTAEELLRTLGAKELDSGVAALFDEDEAPAPEPDAEPATDEPPTS
jgi:uncharacterized membrane protein